MIEKKQPDVILCCYRSRHATKYKEFEGNGVGRTPACFQSIVQGRSYVLNHVEDKSALRTLFILEAMQAFRRANGTWTESFWMDDVRGYCAAIVKQEKPGKNGLNSPFCCSNG
jgi:hypothetical protein